MMQKFIKLSLLIIPALSLLSLTTCSKSTEPSTGLYEQFISDRTFSIGCGCDELWNTIDENHIFSHGTGWILKDATPDNNSDYSYYMATNCHVCETIYDWTCPTDGTTYSLHFLLDDYFEYTDKDNLNYNYTEIEHGTGKFALYPGTTLLGFPTASYKTAYTVNENTSSSIDFRILKVDFGTPSPSVQQKLNRVNEYCKDNNSWAVTFANQYSGNKCYIGGYPYQTGQATKPTWEFHSMKNYSLNTYDGMSSHDIPDKCDYTSLTGQYVDNSPQVLLPSVPYYNNASKKNWMFHGASGSMCINENYQVIGIYWGGWITTDYTTFFPTLSVMNDSTYKNFINLVP